MRFAIANWSDVAAPPLAAPEVFGPPRRGDGGGVVVGVVGRDADFGSFLGSAGGGIGMGTASNWPWRKRQHRKSNKSKPATPSAVAFIWRRGAERAAAHPTAEPSAFGVQVRD